MISLQVRNLRKSFGTKTVFSDINFSHHEGSLGIAGSNGSGKSTLLKCLSGLLGPTAGTVRWLNGGSELPVASLKKKLGYAAPYINLYNELTCRENLRFLAKVRHRSAAVTSAEQWLSRAGLENLADQPFGKLSTGQQQRLRLASALFYEPQILMLDEPGSNLDEAGHSLVREIADDFNRPGRMLIIASNNSNELELCERIFSVEEECFTT